MKLTIVTPTYDKTWLREAYVSFRMQEADWFWFLSPNDKKGNPTRVKELVSELKSMFGHDERVIIEPDTDPHAGIGQRKRTAFLRAAEKTGAEVLIELDHDDLLVPGALMEIERAFGDPEVGFVYSDWADFEPGGELPQGLPTYRAEPDRSDWIRNNFEFYKESVGGLPPGLYECVRAPEPSALALSLVFYAPNHVRAWRRSVYLNIGGHDASWKLCDDHELLCRTYLGAKLVRIPKPLYLYRVDRNTWSKHQAEIRRLTYEVRVKYLERLVLRECELRRLDAVCLGDLPNHPDRWRMEKNFDLAGRWPFEDNSLGAIHAVEVLNRAPKEHAMSEIWRCLAPGGWLLSSTPSANGTFAHLDPRNVSYWNAQSFWYWSRAPFTKSHNVHFQPVVVEEVYPGDWQRKNGVIYVTAEMIAWKPGMNGPGERFFG